MPNFFFPREIPTSLQEVRQEFDRLLDRVWHGGLSTAPLDGQDWAPLVDLVDEPLQYRVRIEVPGLTGDQVDVSVQKNIVTIKGRKVSAYDAKLPPRLLRAECRYGTFERRIELPGPIQEDAIKATCRCGVLMLEIPKTPVAVGRSVRVDDAGSGEAT